MSWFKFFFELSNSNIFFLYRIEHFVLLVCKMLKRTRGMPNERVGAYVNGIIIYNLVFDNKFDNWLRGVISSEGGGGGTKIFDLSGNNRYLLEEGGKASSPTQLPDLPQTVFWKWSYIYNRQFLLKTGLIWLFEHNSQSIVSLTFPQYFFSQSKFGLDRLKLYWFCLKYFGSNLRIYILKNNRWHLYWYDIVNMYW